MPRKQQRFRITLADDLLKEKLTLHLIQDDFAKGRYRIRYKGRLSTRYHDTTGTIIAQRVSKWMQRQQNKAHTPLDICISNIIGIHDHDLQRTPNRHARDGLSS